MSMPGEQVCILWHLQVDRWHTIVITHLVPLKRYDLFLITLVSHTSYKQTQYI